jgi:hypothetical protein
VPYAIPNLPQPPPIEQCAADGYGNGVDENGDGQIDEGCLARPVFGCFTGGTLAPIGSTFTRTMKNGEVDPFILARDGEGWILISRRKVKNQTTVEMRCDGL